MRENKTIRNHYLGLTKQREREFKGILKVLIHDKIIREEKLPNEYSFLYTRFQILGDFWISSAEVTIDSSNSKTISKFSEIISQTIYPYLTKKGQRMYIDLS